MWGFCPGPSLKDKDGDKICMSWTWLRTKNLFSTFINIRFGWIRFISSITLQSAKTRWCQETEACSSMRNTIPSLTPTPTSPTFVMPPKAVGEKVWYDTIRCDTVYFNVQSKTDWLPPNVDCFLYDWSMKWRRWKEKKMWQDDVVYGLQVVLWKRGNDRTERDRQQRQAVITFRSASDLSTSYRLWNAMWGYLSKSGLCRASSLSRNAWSLWCRNEKFHFWFSIFHESLHNFLCISAN